MRNPVANTVIVLALIALLSAALPAAAPAQPTGVWFDATFGFGTYLMEDVNQGIRDAKTEDAGLNWDEIGSGFAWGVKVGYDVSPRVTLSVGFERMYAGSEGKAKNYGLEYNLPATAFLGTATYNGSLGKGWRIGFGGSLGLVSVRGQYRESFSSGEVTSERVQGTGPLFDAFLCGDFWNQDGRLGLFGAAGYRFAYSTETTVGGGVITNDSGRNATVDYSGLLLRIGLRFVP